MVLLCMITCALESALFQLPPSTSGVRVTQACIGLQFLRLLTAHSRWYVPFFVGCCAVACYLPCAGARQSASDQLLRWRRAVPLCAAVPHGCAISSFSMLWKALSEVARCGWAGRHATWFCGMDPLQAGCAR